MEVEQNSDEVGNFVILNANDNEDSMTGFTPASRVTHDMCTMACIAPSQAYYSQHIHN